MSSAVVIRAATPADIPALRDFLAPFVRLQQILPRDEEDLHTLTRHGFVAEHHAAIVGFAAIEIYSRKLAEVQSLAVRTDFQGKGIGRQLVEACVERAKSEGVLELMAITASEKLFRDSGFDYSLPNQKRALFVQTNLTSTPRDPRS